MAPPGALPPRIRAHPPGSGEHALRKAADARPDGASAGSRPLKRLQSEEDTAPDRTEIDRRRHRK